MKIIEQLRQELSSHLRENILPFWMINTLDSVHGGFVGKIDGRGQVIDGAEKGLAINARILWTFSSAYRIFQNEEYLKIARRAKEYIGRFFADGFYGGLYSVVDAQGNPKDNRKQVGMMANVVYGLSEYARATGDTQSLKQAVWFFYDIERYCFDMDLNGYQEGATRNWYELESTGVNPMGVEERKYAATHLRVLEAYVNLYREWKDPYLAGKITNLIDLFLSKMIDQKTGRLALSFTDSWEIASRKVSNGFQLEAAWMLLDAVHVVADAKFIKDVEAIVPKMIAVAEDGLQADGSVLDEPTDIDRHGWVQAEAVLAFSTQYMALGEEQALEKAAHCWKYIQANLVDLSGGEWFNRVSADGTPYKNDPKVDFWKSPYHNGRMCMALVERLK